MLRGGSQAVTSMVSVVRSGPKWGLHPHPGARPGAGRAEELDGTGVGHPLGVSIETACLFPHSLHRERDRYAHPNRAHEDRGRAAANGTAAA